MGAAGGSGKSTPRIRDVAELAGVSTATVSHVLNGTRVVRQSTKELVDAAIESLGYQRSLVARGLRRQRSDAIGVVVPDLHGSFFPGVVRGVEQRLFEEDYTYFLSHTDDSVQREAASLNRLAGWSVEGLLLAPVVDDVERRWDVLSRTGATVFIDRRPELVGLSNEEHASVYVDNYRASYKAADHLLSNGFRRIAIVSPQAVAGPVAERAEGVRARLARAGLPSLEAPLVGVGEDAGTLQTGQLLERTPRPDVIFTTTNRSGFGVMRTLRDRGLRVPDDIGLVVFDDADWAEMADITAIRTSPAELGATAAGMLLRLLKGEELPGPSVAIPATLVARGSTARPPEASGR